MTMFLLTYHGRPNKKYKGGPIGGAYINCYVKTTNIVKADKIATTEIKKLNWDIVEKTETKKVTKSSFDKGSDGLEYYEQALIDKEVFVFHTYPIRKKRRTSKATKK